MRRWKLPITPTLRSRLIHWNKPRIKPVPWWRMWTGLGMTIVPRRVTGKARKVILKSPRQRTEIWQQAIRQGGTDMANSRNHVHARKSRLKGRVDSIASKDIASGEIARGKGGWVILKEHQSGIWSTVSGPVPTRESARQLRIDALSALMNDPSGSSAKTVDVDIFVGKPEQRRTAVLCANDHEWVVYSTALLEGWLMLQCVECGAMGTIDDPSPEEWSGA